MKSVLSDTHFHSEAAAFSFVEAWLWPNGPVCPHCGATDRINRLEGVRSKPSKKNPQGVERLGLWKCYHCREQFTVRMGTVFESSHAPLHIWLQAIYLLCSSKKGISTRQLQRTLKCGMKTAWFLGMRIREAMAPNGSGKLGGPDVIVEADETEISLSKKTWRNRKPRSENKKFVSLVERDGHVRSRVITGAKGEIGREIRQALYANVDRDSTLHTDLGSPYRTAWPMEHHWFVDHSREFKSVDGAHINTAEGYFSIFKRGLVGTYQHMSEQHLHRYLAEFDFRMNNRERLGVNDEMRAVKALQGVVGKRLTYQTSDHQAA